MYDFSVSSLDTFLGTSLIDHHTVLNLFFHENVYRPSIDTDLLKLKQR